MIDNIVSRRVFFCHGHSNVNDGMMVTIRIIQLTEENEKKKKVKQLFISLFSSRYFLTFFLLTDNKTKGRK